MDNLKYIYIAGCICLLIPIVKNFFEYRRNARKIKEFRAAIKKVEK